MSNEPNVKIIAHIHNDYHSKFGIPRQSCIVNSVISKIIFEPEYRNSDILRGMDGYSYLWLIWYFSMSADKPAKPTVRPPKLGGNTRMGVFATRSPYRPSPIGLSSVKIESIDANSKHGPIICVSGADLADGTPIIDIKPYLAYTDSHPTAKSGFACINTSITEIIIPNNIKSKLSDDVLKNIKEILINDPRPGYQHDPNRIYKFSFGEYDFAFCSDGSRIKVISAD